MAADEIFIATHRGSQCEDGALPHPLVAASTVQYTSHSLSDCIAARLVQMAVAVLAAARLNRPQIWKSARKNRLEQSAAISTF